MEAILKALAGLITAMSGQLGLVIGVVLGFLSSVLTEPVRDRLFGPKLQVEFDPDKQGFATHTKDNIGHDFVQASYIRVLATNKRKRIAKQCRAYLSGVEMWNASLRRFEPTLYCEALQLAWSASPEGRAFDPVDIPKDVRKFVDVVSVREGSTSIRSHVIAHLYRYEDMLTKQSGKFRYTVLVAGDNMKPQSVKVGLEWNGDFKQYRVFKG